MNSAGTLSQKYKVIVVYQKHIFTFQQRNALYYLVYIGAVDGLYYMSSPNVVFVCKAGRMFYTVK